ncbi:MAG: transcriptional regulator [Rhodanobacteraceae bacterium]|nr:MAG: transcriptional regulator [Rhodanobacteraceae bacterium]
MQAGGVAAAADPARLRTLCCLLDGRARTAAELARAAGVTAVAQDAQLAALLEQRLLRVAATGRRRYYALRDAETAQRVRALAGAVRQAPFVPRTPVPLRAARTCYDHMAGTWAVALGARLLRMRWLRPPATAGADCSVTPAGVTGLRGLDIDVGALRRGHRRLAYPCLDWSERRPHIGGALGAALLCRFLQRGWVVRDTGSRALEVTRSGQQALRARFHVDPQGSRGGRDQFRRR